jgi:tetratricopeptide (TPR) repeat protein
MSVHIPENNNEDSGIRKNFGSHLDALRNNDPDQCPSTELLVSYQKKELTGKTRITIEDHIILCPFCLEALEALSATEKAEIENEILPDNWRVIEKEIDEKFYSYLPNITPVQKRTTFLTEMKNILAELWQSISEVILPPKRLVYAGAVAVLAILSIYSYAYFSRDKYFSLARIEPEQRVHMRGEAINSALTEGLEQYSQEKYDESIAQLENYLETNPDNYTANYYLGLSHLAKAELKLLGLAYKFDNSETEKGITSLSRATQLSGDNLYYQADCYWYLGKAYLMMGAREKAKQQFLNITLLNQPHLVIKDKAEEMIKNLN